MRPNVPLIEFCSKNCVSNFRIEVLTKFKKTCIVCNHMTISNMSDMFVEVMPDVN